jgi:hypothetical protein
MPERGKGGGLKAPDSCYLDGENMQTVVILLCPQRGAVAADYRDVMQFVVAAAIMTEGRVGRAGRTLHQLAPSSLPITRCHMGLHLTRPHYKSFCGRHESVSKRVVNQEGNHIPTASLQIFCQGTSELPRKQRD